MHIANLVRRSYSTQNLHKYLNQSEPNIFITLTRTILSTSSAEFLRKKEYIKLYDALLMGKIALFNNHVLKFEAKSLFK